MRARELFEKGTILPDIEKKFGRVLFGDWQYENGVRPEHEQDTEYEERVFTMVQNWFWGKTYDLDIQETLEGLSVLKDNYPTLLKPDSAQRFPYLYRALRMPLPFTEPDRELTKMPMDYEPEMSDISIKSRSRVRGTFQQVQNYQMIDTKQTIMYHPKATAESWTVSLKSALDIQTNHFGNFASKIAVIKAAVPDEERLFKLKFTLKMYQSMKQFEIVRVSDNPIQAEVFYFRHA